MRRRVISGYGSFPQKYNKVILASAQGGGGGDSQRLLSIFMSS